MPDTRHSLILRLPNGTDAEAWNEFVEIYGPLIYRLARSKSFQDADAQEIVQEVLVAVSGAVERWDPDVNIGRFRDWLFRIARNLMINFLTRRRYQPVGNQQLSVSQLLEHPFQQDRDASNCFDLEYRRQVFRWAADTVEAEVSRKHWSAFWRTSVDGLAISDVAEELGMTTGAVYIVRSRVMAKLRAASSRFEDEPT
ncbi:MAG: RNA polymerase sigma factor [Planctomycetaceae bacterium]